MAGVNEYKELNNSNIPIRIINNTLSNNTKRAQKAYKIGLNYNQTGIGSDEAQILRKMLIRADNRGIEELVSFKKSPNSARLKDLERIENGLKRMARWDPNDPVVVERKQIENKIITDGKVKYWEDTIKRRAERGRFNGRNRWVKNQLERSKQAQSALTQKKGWFFGGKHRKTHKRPNHNKRNKTKRNHN